MRLLPELADVAAADGVPINRVHCMTGLINRTRSYTHSNGAPRVLGLLACGDDHTCTNPAYGRGQSLALRMATMIADAVTETDDLGAAARLYESRCKNRSSLGITSRFTLTKRVPVQMPSPRPKVAESVVSTLPVLFVVVQIRSLSTRSCES